MKSILSIINNGAQSLLAMCSILLHLLLIIVCVRSKVVCKNFANFTIFQTAIADFIFCIGIIFLIINETVLYFPKSNIFINNCIIILTSLFFGYQIRDVTVIFITINRWAALRFPVFFREIPLKTKINITFIVSQIYALISIIISWFSREIDYTTKSCQSYYIYKSKYLLWFHGLICILLSYINCGQKNQSSKSDKKKGNRKQGKEKKEKIVESKKQINEENTEKCTKKESSKIASNTSNMKEPEAKPLNEKETKILKNEAKADENEYPTMQDCIDGFKNTPTIDTTGNNKSQKK
ncbi:GPCR, rhodopsin-like, 7TM domain and 7TM GPCR, serpentine receptor class x (Srx) family-containing protein [Strongyloides ratti]|uniref:GPCR, rhodopsin-like, 7TM domain and 7TM GPCR, serpentine receptor class x (Srx) family-containing protein n=1 Tax=Strongyloides ratti TaxID=34506 RepID=A0A090LKK5_STRRB|nr:GPCR, rhodopsin-like, 7TM domain and 7TM GPCR, serpentine receptor class x (Srx) family-containing protein [Strongyloides ratti]CEF70352.1 GPCR, rhodopsin-like, 7TM domain and 7TM GPCR, serpentine receptor class x (Srx) family-containing protein [Strongyloides ratti]